MWSGHKESGASSALSGYSLVNSPTAQVGFLCQRGQEWVPLQRGALGEQQWERRAQQIPIPENTAVETIQSMRSASIPAAVEGGERRYTLEPEQYLQQILLVEAGNCPCRAAFSGSHRDVPSSSLRKHSQRPSKEKTPRHLLDCAGQVGALLPWGQDVRLPGSYSAELETEFSAQEQGQPWHRASQGCSLFSSRTCLPWDAACPAFRLAAAR